MAKAYLSLILSSYVVLGLKFGDQPQFLLPIKK